MVLNAAKGITIEQGVWRVIEINEALSRLPCLGYKEGSTTAMAATSIKYPDIEL